MAIIGNPVIAAIKPEIDTAFDASSSNPVTNSLITEYVKRPDLTLFQDEETKLVYVATLEGELLGDGILVEGGGGGGGGGGGNTYTPKLTNLMDSRDIVVSQGGSAVLVFRYSSVDEDGVDDGPGVGTIRVNGIQKAKIGVAQGDNSIDISSIIDAGENAVIVQVENSEGATKSLKYTVTVVSLSISTTFNELSWYTGEVDYSFTVTGTGTKVVHFVMDGEEIGTMDVMTSNRSQVFTIPAQSHGGHVFEAYAVLPTDGMQLRSSTLRHGMLWIDSQSSVPAITSTFKLTEATEGEIISVPYIVYDPLQENATIVLSVLNPDGSVYSEQSITVDRLAHTWNLTDYPTGDIRLVLSCGSASAEFPVHVSAYSLPVEEVTDSLLLKFDAGGRSNGEANPAHWSYKGITASFSGFGWNTADGWIDDDDGATVLRFLPGDTMYIPFMPFEQDARATGYTIEVEMATRDVRDYESVVISSMNGGRGFRVASQEASLTSEQSSVSMLFKEDARVRVAFSVENRNLNRLVYIYINGIMCGVTQYPADDNFQQPTPVGITIGAESCGLDLYKIRCYNKGLTRAEQLDNFIIDRSTLAERVDASERNDILNDSEEVTIAKLPNYLPYMVVKAVELPQYKGDKKKNLEVTYVEPLRPERSWTATGVEMDVQGTSSQGYPVKNYKIKLKSGITYSNGTDSEGNPRTDSGFPIHDGELPTKTICFKADYASSENANNVVLAQLYNDIVPYETEPQRENEKIRQGIDGFGIALFWQNASNVVTFIGKGNCNVDKGNEHIFGFTDAYPHCESWEFKNNTSNRVLFKSADFSGDAWLTDFEARYPDTDPAYTDATQMQRVFSWVVSTDRDAVSTQAEKDARLQKFVNEFEQYFVKAPMLFYYLFTEAFLMVDNRAKNMFLTTFDGTHWIPFPYDFDTAIGINNEGALTFGYSLEDTDHVGTANVYNGQDSVLWCNVRDGFASELASMYAQLRTMTDPNGTAGSPFSYAKIAKRFTEHQSVWPEALWNEDAFIKYLQPYLTANENYLAMLQGNKASQRDWWLFNRFRYLDSKYRCGDAQSNFITLRCYAVGNITLTPYADIHARVRFGSYDTPDVRVPRNHQETMVCGLDTMNDTEVYIYSSDLISSVGDLSGLQVGLANFAMAPKLREIKLGDESPSYSNMNLGKESNTFDVGSNDLLETVNIANCAALGTGTQKAVDLSGCTGLKTVIATGTQLRGITLPNGGHLTTLKLPATMTNFTVLNQRDLTTLVFEGYGNIETLRVENTPNVPIETLITANPGLSRVRLIDTDWTASSAESLQTIYDKLITCGGMDASGSNTQKAVVSGIVRVDEAVDQELLDAFTENFPDLLVMAGGVATCTVRFRNWDGTLLDTQTCQMGGSVLDPVESRRISVPGKQSGNHTVYTYAGWDKELTNIQRNMIVTAVYTEEHAFEVTFVNADAGATVLYKALVRDGQNVPDPVAARYISTPSLPTDAQYVYTYIGWDDSLYNITEDKTIRARYTTDPSVTVTFVNWDDTVLAVRYIASGDDVDDPVATGEIEAPTRPTDSQLQVIYTYKGWSKALTNITESTTISAVFNTIQYYIVTFKNADIAGGAVLYTTTLNRGSKVIDPYVNGDISVPTCPATPTYGYIFKGWDAPLSTFITSNLTYTAAYKTDRQFTVTFVDWDGTRLDTQLVYDEDNADDPVTSGRIPTPTRASTEKYDYTFRGWDTSYGTVTEDRTITALYTESIRQYNYRFLNNDGRTVLKSGLVNYGTTVTPPSPNPSYIPENEYMQFDGWSPNTFTITADTDFIAQYIDTSSLTVKYLMKTLTEVDNNTVTSLRDYALYRFPKLETVTVAATEIGYRAISGCPSLKTVDLTEETEKISIKQNAFQDSYMLDTMFIRSNTVASLGTDGLRETLIGVNLGGIYVPDVLVDNYKVANNWSTHANQIYPISAYPVTDFSTITEDWDEIVSMIDNGTFTTKYTLGDQKRITINGVDTYMVLIAIDTDELADGSGLAKTTWLSAHCIDKRQLHSQGSIYGAGWPDTDLYSWLNQSLLPTLPDVIRANVKEVTKTFRYANESRTLVTDASSDSIWIPSLRELQSNYTSYESYGVTYYPEYFRYHSRMRTYDGAASTYWTRSTYGTGTGVTGDGTTGTSLSTQYGIVIGFCI